MFSRKTVSFTDRHPTCSASVPILHLEEKCRVKKKKCVCFPQSLLDICLTSSGGWCRPFSNLPHPARHVSVFHRARRVGICQCSSFCFDYAFRNTRHLFTSSSLRRLSFNDFLDLTAPASIFVPCMFRPDEQDRPSVSTWNRSQPQPKPIQTASTTY